MPNKLELVSAIQDIIAIPFPSYALKEYLHTILWSSTDDNEDPLDSNYGARDFSKEALNTAKKDLTSFWKKAGDMIKKEKPENVAHDFWLTRNGHGSGFWDGDYPEYGDELTKIAEKFKELDPYVGDDGKIYFQ